MPISAGADLGRNGVGSTFAGNSGLALSMRASDGEAVCGSAASEVIYSVGDIGVSTAVEAGVVDAVCGGHGTVAQACVALPAVGDGVFAADPHTGYDDVGGSLGLQESFGCPVLDKDDVRAALDNGIAAESGDSMNS